jgi:arginyl-tRNA--protein-N-Asp/Glu arginylyltransferase
MKLLFSEYKSDYENYIFPYAIWAIPEEQEKPAFIFSRGFLPSSRNLDLFYMCRQIRIVLNSFKPSSENRRILKKGFGIEYKLIPIELFEYTEARKQLYKNYADIKFGKDVMTYQRLDSLFDSKIINHLLIFTDALTRREVGTVTLYIENKSLVYYYAFYDLNYRSRNLGIYMMTRAVEYFAKQQFKFIYLGTCYSRNALYKTQFSGAEFFNGFRWSNNLDELKYLIKRLLQNICLKRKNFVKNFMGKIP